MIMLFNRKSCCLKLREFMTFNSRSMSVYCFNRFLSILSMSDSCIYNSQLSLYRYVTLSLYRYHNLLQRKSSYIYHSYWQSSSSKDFVLKTLIHDDVVIYHQFHLSIMISSYISYSSCLRLRLFLTISGTAIVSFSSSSFRRYWSRVSIFSG